MTKCPRCNLEQEESAQCEYCGLVFETLEDSTPAAKAVQPKRTVLFAIILIVAGVLVAGYLFISDQEKPGARPEIRISAMGNTSAHNLLSDGFPKRMGSPEETIIKVVYSIYKLIN